MRFVMESYDSFVFTQTRSLWPHGDCGFRRTTADTQMERWIFTLWRTCGQHNESWLYSILGILRLVNPWLNYISIGTTRQIQSIIRYSLLPSVSPEAESSRYSLAGFGSCHAPRKPAVPRLDCSHYMFDITDMHALISISRVITVLSDGSS